MNFCVNKFDASCVQSNARCVLMICKGCADVCAASAGGSGQGDDQCQAQGRASAAH